MPLLRVILMKIIGMRVERASPTCQQVRLGKSN